MDEKKDKIVHIENPIKPWCPGDRRVEPFMEHISVTLARNGIQDPAKTDIYNRAYEAVYAAICTTEKKVPKLLKDKFIAIENLLTVMNKVTAYWRHGNKKLITDKMMDDICNAQIEAEKELRELKIQHEKELWVLAKDQLSCIDCVDHIACNRSVKNKAICIQGIIDHAQIEAEKELRELKNV